MGALDVSPEDITRGPIPRTLVVLALPLLAQNLVHVLNQLVDTFWLGRVGEVEVAAIGLNFPLMAVMFSVTAAATVGTQILVAQRVGADQERAARRLTVNGLLLAFGLGIVLLGIVLLAGEWVVGALGAGPEVGPLAVAYLVIFAAFFPFGTAGDALERGFVGWGDTRAALYINVVAVGTNIVLDPFLILGIGPFPRLEVQGAALATGIGYLLGFAAALALATGLRSSLQLTMADLAPSLADQRALLDTGSPVSGQFLAAQTARVAIIGVVATVGGAAGLAAYTVGARIATVAFVPATGFGNAAQSMVGQNLGADRPDRAHGTIRTGVAIAGGTLFVVGAIQWLVPGLLAEVFVPTLTETGFALTVDYLEILAYSYWAMGVSAVLLAAFNGAARTRTGLVIDVLKYWGIRIPAAAAALPAAYVVIWGVPLGGLDLGVHAVFWAVTVSNVLTAVGVGAYYYRRHERMFHNAATEASEASEAVAD